MSKKKKCLRITREEHEEFIRQLQAASERLKNDPEALARERKEQQRWEGLLFDALPDELQNEYAD